MPTSTLPAPRSPARLTAVDRCLELRPVRAQLGLASVTVGVGRVILGSAIDCDVVLPIEGVAARHCELQFNGRDAVLKVISPLTWLNDGPVREAVLRAGDVVTLGPVEFQTAFVDVPQPPPAPRDELAPTARVGREQTTTLQRPANRRPVSAVSVPAKEMQPVAPVEPLLDEAEAGRRLRRDIERLEREAAWHQQHAVALPASPPVTSRPSVHDEALNQLQKRRTERELELTRREETCGQSERQIIERNRELEQRSRSVQQDQQQIAAERQQLVEQLQSLRQQREALAKTQAALQSEQATAQQRSGELLNERRRLEALTQSLGSERQQLEQQRSELETRHAEFDAAVAALDDDRELLRRDREVARQEAQSAVREAEQLRSRISAALDQMAQRESGLQEQLRQLEVQAEKLAAAERTRHDEARRLTDEQAAKQRQLSLREAQLHTREQRLAVRETDVQRRLDEYAVATADLSRERDELQAERLALESAQADVAHLRGQCAAEQERLRVQRQALSEQAARLQADQRQWQERLSQLDVATVELQSREEESARREAEQQAALRDLETQRQALDRRQAALESQDRTQAARLTELAAQATAGEARLAEQADLLQLEQQQLAATRQAQQHDEQRLAAEFARLQSVEGDLQLRLEELSTRELSFVLNSSQDAAQSLLTQDAADLRIREAALERAQAELSRREQELETELDRWQSQQPSGDSQSPGWAAEKAEIEALHAAAASTAEAAVAALRSALDDVSTERDQLRDQVDELYRERLSAPATAQPDPIGSNSVAEFQLRQQQLSRAEQDLAQDAARLQASWSDFESAAAELETERRVVHELREALATERAHWERCALSANQQPHAGTTTGHAADVHQPVAISVSSAVGDPAIFDVSGAYEAKLQAERDAAQQLEIAKAAAGELIAEDSQPAPVRDEPVAAPQDGSAIRSQLAALFGISATELDATAARHHEEDIPEQPRVAQHELETQFSSVAPIVVQEQPAPVESLPLPTSDADSIADYMQRLLSQSQVGQSAAPEVAPTRTAEPHRDVVAEPVVAVQAVTSSDESAASRNIRRNEELDVAEQRAQMDSMRQIANHSARAAVATHYSRKLQLTYQVMLLLTVIGIVLSLGLFAISFFTASSYHVQAIGAGVISIITGLELIRTQLRIKRVRKIVDSAATVTANEPGSSEKPAA